MQNFDLHCHTTASDGSYAPSGVMAKAKKEGIQTIAITDHDTVSGLAEAQKAALQHELNFIPGIEISAEFNPGILHICGYFIDPENDHLNNQLSVVQHGRSQRNPRIIKKLNELGIPISMEEVRQAAGDDQVGRPHFARVLVKKGFVESMDQAFDQFLAKGKPAYVERQRLSPEDAIHTIHQAGGKTVIAHPATLGFASGAEYKSFLQNMKASGLNGIEAFSSYHSREQNIFFVSLAKELNLCLTGGSDFHGANKPEISLGEFALNENLSIDKMILELKNS